MKDVKKFRRVRKGKYERQREKIKE